MSYSTIDPIIEAQSLELFTSFAGEQRRFGYPSSSTGECFQISI
jgi:hypothetical protein